MAAERFVLGGFGRSGKRKERSERMKIFPWGLEIILRIASVKFDKMIIILVIKISEFYCSRSEKCYLAFEFFNSFDKEIRQGFL